jgi:quinol monooxygenase YgiN
VPAPRSPQVVVVATVEVLPGREDEALALAEELVTVTHDEAGCLAYAVHRDLDAPGRLVLVERWTSPVALEAHLLSPHARAFAERIGALVSAPPVVTRTSPVVLGDPVKGAL